MAMLRYFSGRFRPASQLSVLHIHHGLRPEADEDMRLVIRYCSEAGMGCTVKRIHPHRRAARQSVEMWAREERYRCFAEAARDTGSDFILTAHHRDDLVETVLQRLGRGTGFKGLQGIPFCRENRIIRPFLNRTRAEIRQYLDLTQTPWREDDSNRDVRIERNRYRLHLMPKWREQNPQLNEQVARIAFTVQDLWPRMQALFPVLEIEKDEIGRPYLPWKSVENALPHSESLKPALEDLLAAARVGSPDATPERLPPRGVTQKILDELRRQGESGIRGLKVNLNAYWQFQAEKAGLFCAFRPDHPAGEVSQFPEWGWDPAEGPLKGSWGGRTFNLCAWYYPQTHPIPANPDFPGAGEPIALFDADLLSCRLRIRTRKRGDKFSPLGISSHSRKLKAFFNEKKVPLRERDALPLLCTSDRVIWVPGYGLSEFHRIGDGTRRILKLVLQWENQ